MRGSLKRSLAVAGMVTAAFIGLEGPALAAQWNSVNGICNQNGQYTVSSNLRHITTPNDTIKIYLTSVPYQGLYIYAINNDTGAHLGGTPHLTSIGSQTNYAVMATAQPSGMVFRNVFAQGAAGGGTPNWTGSQFY